MRRKKLNLPNEQNEYEIAKYNDGNQKEMSMIDRNGR